LYHLFSTGTVRIYQPSVFCLGRGESLFGPDSAELRIIREGLGDFPLVGFFDNGEIPHDKIYGYTGVLTLFLDAPIS
jgi:small ligand-binding sensory domain FIST